MFSDHNNTYNRLSLIYFRFIMHYHISFIILTLLYHMLDDVQDLFSSLDFLSFRSLNIINHSTIM
ncbi:hypothetical protein HanIR_Chr17g0877991 [Helianthus annuus]|nr:hypothetical protein HanIR_Chr17g0877991 [Helianthus annuus]